MRALEGVRDGHADFRHQIFSFSGRWPYAEVVTHDAMGCPACGGAGGGPFGPPGSAWDVETYECPRCHGMGMVGAGDLAHVRPLAKGTGKGPTGLLEKRGIVSTRPSPKRATTGTDREEK